MVSLFPVGFAPTVSSSTTGICVGILFRAKEDTTVDGVRFLAPGTGSGSCALYDVAVLDGGDGSMLFEDTDVSWTAGNNLFPAPEPIDLIAGHKYLAMVGINNGGAYYYIDNGSEPLDQGPFNTVNEWWGVFSSGSVLPVEAVGVPLAEPPFTQAHTFYGVGVYYDSLPTRIEHTLQRISDTEVRINYVLPGDAPAGITIARCPGFELGNDGEGRAPSNPAYSPGTIEGAYVLVEGLMVTHYNDTDIDPPGAYTWWVGRTKETP